MSEYCREEHPLLEEVSEGGHCSPRYYRRGQMRFKTKHLKGAAAVLTRWPDHWSSILSYWWIGLGMISVTAFIIYHCVFAFSMLPPASLQPSKLIYETMEDKGTVKTSATLDVFMHVFADHSKEINIIDYMPYIEAVSQKFVNFRYNLIVVINDTNEYWLGPGENNDLALNLLLKNDKTITRQNTIIPNVQVKYITLSAYMDNSPLAIYWRILPPELTEFMARAVSIWDKGGIAFNPLILRERYQNELYIKKLHNLLNKYSHPKNSINDEISPDRKLFPTTTKSRLTKKNKHANNIRDIINSLVDDGDSISGISDEKLVVAENIVMPTILRYEPHNINNKSNVKKTSNEKTEINISTEKNHFKQRNQISNINADSGLQSNNNNSKRSLLPLLIKILFDNEEKNYTSLKDDVKTTKLKNLVNNSKSAEGLISSQDSIEDSATRVEEGLKSVSVEAPGISDNLKNCNSRTKSFETVKIPKVNELTIDLKGNIIATDTACHAFLGTIFSNVVHHSNEQNLTDFIISELTIFCKGLLSSCIGIDLIL